MSLAKRVLTVTVSVTLGALVLAGCARVAARPLATAPSDTASPAGSAAGDTSASPGFTAGSRSTPSGRAPFSPADYKRMDALKDVHFEFDKADVRAEDRGILDANAAWMLEHRGYAILIEGHADERGTSEYNLALGDKRGKSAMNYLVSKGVAASRFIVLSYGEERAVCREHSEACWAKNRRASFLVKPE